jgi:hypothetical protein
VSLDDDQGDVVSLLGVTGHHVVGAARYLVAYRQDGARGSAG